MPKFIRNEFKPRHSAWKGKKLCLIHKGSNNRSRKINIAKPRKTYYFWTKFVYTTKWCCREARAIINSMHSVLSYNNVGSTGHNRIRLVFLAKKYARSLPEISRKEGSCQERNIGKDEILKKIFKVFGSREVRLNHNKKECSGRKKYPSPV